MSNDFAYLPRVNCRYLLDCKMTIRQAFVLLTCIFATTSFVATYLNEYDDREQEQVENNAGNLLDLLQVYTENNKENRRNIEDEFENWTGRWMPHRPGSPSSEVLPGNKLEYYEPVTEPSHEMYMGNVSPQCDDGKTNLTIDWDHTPTEYTCYGHKIVPEKITPIFYSEQVPSAYKAVHKCMNEIIEYDTDVPLYGTHRPLWPAYGEYVYVPKQRWLHSLEHGAIVMLYHPCANPLEVERLRTLVSKCLWRHVITPYSYLDEGRPLALLSWGCKLTMSYVNPTLVKRFIQENALRAPERNSADGYFKDGLLSRSSIVTDSMDSVLCPDM